ncbi:MAG: transposase [Actinomycetota bacterium]|nr:transposase [Actinomycetota bacterium]
MTLTTADLRAVAPDDGLVTPRADRPRRRSFTPEYKLAILAEYDGLTEPGEKGALLRREGLYSSHLVEWRRARDAGALAGLADKPRPAKRSPEQIELERMRARAEKAERELAKTKAGWTSWEKRTRS